MGLPEASLVPPCDGLERSPVSNALPYSMSNVSIPAAPASRPRPTFQLSAVAAAHRSIASGAPVSSIARGAMVPAYGRPATLPPPAPVPLTTAERMLAGRQRIRAAAEAGVRIRSYEVALDLDMSEFHFARQFRAAFGRSPHVYYDDVRAERARALLNSGLPEGEVARRVGFRRPAEIRNLLSKHAAPKSG
jgi:AraC family transcriptional regulator